MPCQQRELVQFLGDICFTSQKNVIQEVKDGDVGIVQLQKGNEKRKLNNTESYVVEAWDWPKLLAKVLVKRRIK